MSLPEQNEHGLLPIGLHAASGAQIMARFGVGSTARERQAQLLRQILAAASSYEAIKHVLLWGSFVSDKAEPRDLDYSLVVSVDHRMAAIAPEHRRFLVPFEARQFYGADQGFLVIPDYSLERYIEKLDFVSRDHDNRERGIVGISLRGEVAYE